MDKVKRWIQQKAYRRQARAWLKVGSGPAIAARVMFTLNRDARYMDRLSLTKKIIYDLKNRLIRDLYERGFCRETTLQEQKLLCYSCDGSGEFWTGQVCRKCGGSGIYRRHYLYKFVFSVDSRHYVWHQPKELVDWPVELTWSGRSDYRPSGNGFDEISQDVRLLYVVTVRQYLRLAGVPVEDLPELWTLRRAVRSDWKFSWLYYKWLRIRRWWNRLKDRVDQIRVFFREGYWPPSEDEVPF